MPNDKRIKPNDDGTYYVRYEAGFKPDGNRNQKYKSGFRTVDDAAAYLNEQEHGIRHGTYIDPNKILVCEYLLKWLADREEAEELSPTTYSGYEVNIRCHINPFIGGIRVQDLRAFHIKDIYVKLQKDHYVTIDDEKCFFKKLSPKSILYVRRVLSKALEDAVALYEIIERNPAKAAKSPKVPKYKAKFLSAIQVKTMLQKFEFENDEMYIPVYLAVVLGLRRGEVLGLRWHNIDFESKTIMIRGEYTMAAGKPIYMEEVKSEDSERDIVVTDRIITLLKAHQTKQKVLKLQYGEKYFKSDFICAWPDGALMNPSHISRSFKERLIKYNLPVIRFHDLRHSNGALMTKQNVPLKGASERLGHSTIVITNDFYGHIERSAQEEIALSIDRAIWGEETQ